MSRVGSSLTSALSLALGIQQDRLTALFSDPFWCVLYII